MIALHRLQIWAVSLCLAVMPLGAAAGETLLQVAPLQGQVLDLDRSALESLPQQTFKTTTIWTEGVTEFSGPSLRHVLAEAGIAEGRVMLQALNDYQVDVLLSELDEAWPIIATRRDGAPYDVRENGPLWVVFPYDQGGSFSQERSHAISIWQLVRIEELPE